jgi:hypothetical protein
MTYWKECHDETEMGLHGLIGRHGCRQVWVKPVEGVLIEDRQAAIERIVHCIVEHEDDGYEVTALDCDFAGDLWRAVVGDGEQA